MEHPDAFVIKRRELQDFAAAQGGVFDTPRTIYLSFEGLVTVDEAREFSAWLPRAAAWVEAGGKEERRG